MQACHLGREQNSRLEGNLKPQRTEHQSFFDGFVPLAIMHHHDVMMSRKLRALFKALGVWLCLTKYA